jgi:hypothetical protein
LASPLPALEDERGLQDPVGFWDPLRFSSNGNAQRFRRRRCIRMRTSHIKSLTLGGVSMLVTIGYISLDITSKLPGYSSTSMSSRFGNSGYKVHISCGSGHLTAEMTADLVNGRFDILVIIC